MFSIFFSTVPSSCQPFQIGRLEDPAAATFASFISIAEKRSAYAFNPLCFPEWFTISGGFPESLGEATKKKEQRSVRKAIGKALPRWLPTNRHPSRAPSRKVNEFCLAPPKNARPFPSSVVRKIYVNFGVKHHAP